MAEAGSPGGRLPLEAYLAEGERQGMIWTRMRRAVLEGAWRAGAPVGAYDLLDRLRRESGRAHLASVYRCLQALQAAGLVVPVLSWKRFLLSPDPRVRLWGLLLCDRCQTCLTIDLTSMIAQLDRRAREQNFSPGSHAIECRGRCRTCRGKGGTS
ncbi:Fur family transcriptional regulator [Sphingosinicella terrae]|jgi:Fur family transcriptional regulator, zinc uptake regulator|uniref:Fur family transcriptional regulator n=1 Tax=Sphingosinicella terrae TaxID=2172047 RepID=UPI000E0DFC05|nr:transcriptional repressor [Sphingosinicella terrae]